MGHETEHWSVYRRYLEFYVLESKLTEFHGNVSACLPLSAPQSQRLTLTAPAASMGVLPHFSSTLMPPTRVVPRRAIAFEENHRPQELRVPHVQAGGVPGVPSGSCRRGICHFNDGWKCLKSWRRMNLFQDFHIKHVDKSWVSKAQKSVRKVNKRAAHYNHVYYCRLVQ